MNDRETILSQEVATLKAELGRVIQDRDRDLANLKLIAQTAKAAKSGFLTNMSHELRTPLTAIIGFAELLSEQHFGKLNERQYTYVREIYNAGNHLLALIKDILDLAKAESGSQTFTPTNVDICELLTNSLSLVKEKSIKHGQRLELDLDRSLIGLVTRADEIKLKQIMVYLLTNAVKFTPDGGLVKVSATRMGNRIAVSVSDTGVGIRTQDLERIFDVFEQVDASCSKQLPGAGLGLALTRRLVELHGGEISAFSNGEGCGATLTFTIPLAPSSAMDDHGLMSPDAIEPGCDAYLAKPIDPGEFVSVLNELKKNELIGKNDEDQR